MFVGSNASLLTRRMETPHGIKELEYKIEISEDAVVCKNESPKFKDITIKGEQLSPMQRTRFRSFRESISTLTEELKYSSARLERLSASMKKPRPSKETEALCQLFDKELENWGNTSQRLEKQQTQLQEFVIDHLNRK